MKKDPFKDLVLDEYEKELEKSLERDEWVSVKHSEKWKKELQEAARKFVEARKSKPVTIRINQEDLTQLKAKAKKKNIPYQTLLGILIRDFVKGDYKIVL